MMRKRVVLALAFALGRAADPGTADAAPVPPRVLIARPDPRDEVLVDAVARLGNELTARAHPVALVACIPLLDLTCTGSSKDFALAVRLFRRGPSLGVTVAIDRSGVGTLTLRETTVRANGQDAVGRLTWEALELTRAMGLDFEITPQQTQPPPAPRDVRLPTRPPVWGLTAGARASVGADEWGWSLGPFAQLDRALSSRWTIGAAAAVSFPQDARFAGAVRHQDLIVLGVETALLEGGRWRLSSRLAAGAYLVELAGAHRSSSGDDTAWHASPAFEAGLGVRFVAGERWYAVAAVSAAVVQDAPTLQAGAAMAALPRPWLLVSLGAGHQL